MLSFPDVRLGIKQHLALGQLPCCSDMKTKQDTLTYAGLVYTVGHVVPLGKPESLGFESRWRHCHFSLNYPFRPHYVPEVDTAPNRNGYQKYFLGWGGLEIWKPQTPGNRRVNPGPEDCVT